MILADLFATSNWTQEELAEKEGVKRNYISYRLCFGRFLQIVTTGDNFQIPVNLTERQFRKCWSETSDDKNNDELRFDKVAEMIKEKSTKDKNGNYVIKKQKLDLPAGWQDAIIDKFADGKWHSKETIAKSLDIDPEQIAKAIGSMKRSKKWQMHQYEERPYRKTRQYRIVKGSGVQVDYRTLCEELEPILKQLEKHGKSNLANMAPPAVVGELAMDIRNLLDKFAR